MKRIGCIWLYGLVAVGLILALAVREVKSRLIKLEQRVSELERRNR